MMKSTRPRVSLRNYSLKDEICRYWTIRSETFDEGPGHGMRSDDEFDAWVGVMRGHLGEGDGRTVLEPGSGTGQMTAVLLSLGFQVTAVDLCQAMIDKAAAKHHAAGARVSFHLGDAENTMMTDAAFDLVVSRHLVWTLLDPAAALADWHRALKPGGRLVIVDGDWVAGPKRMSARLAGLAIRWIDRWTGVEPRYDAAAHEAIVSRVYFNEGLRADRLRAMLQEVGFANILVGDVDDALAAQRRHSGFVDRLRQFRWYDRYFIMSAAKAG